MQEAHFSPNLPASLSGVISLTCGFNRWPGVPFQPSIQEEFRLLFSREKRVSRVPLLYSKHHLFTIEILLI